MIAAKITTFKLEFELCLQQNKDHLDRVSTVEERKEYIARIFQQYQHETVFSKVKVYPESFKIDMVRETI